MNLSQLKKKAKIQQSVGYLKTVIGIGGLAVIAVGLAVSFAKKEAG